MKKRVLEIGIMAALGLLIACTTTVTVRELPDPNSGTVRPTLVLTDRFAGIPIRTRIEYPKTPKSSRQLRSENREALMGMGRWGIVAGVAMGAIGAGLSLAFASGIAHKLGGALVGVGALVACAGLLVMGIAIALTILIILISVATVGGIMYWARDKDIRNILKRGEPDGRL